MYCIVADPSHAGTDYAGTDVGVYKSVDAGATWFSASVGLPSVRVQTIVLDSQTGALYLGTITPNGVDSVGIFKSTDAASSWTAINSGLTDTSSGVSPVDVESLAIDPADNMTLIAGTRDSDIFKSSDGGATWEAETFGGAEFDLETSAVVFQPTNPTTISPRRLSVSSAAPTGASPGTLPERQRPIRKSGRRSHVFHDPLRR